MMKKQTDRSVSIIIADLIPAVNRLILLVTQLSTFTSIIEAAVTVYANIQIFLLVKPLFGFMRTGVRYHFYTNNRMNPVDFILNTPYTVGDCYNVVTEL